MRGTHRIIESLEQTKGTCLRFKAPKTERSRAITLPAFAVEELRRLKQDGSRKKHEMSGFGSNLGSIDLVQPSSA